MIDRYEALARRYCAIKGDDPDAFYDDGTSVLEWAEFEIDAALEALKTFNVFARDQFEEPLIDRQDPSEQLSLPLTNVYRFYQAAESKAVDRQFGRGAGNISMPDQHFANTLV